MPRPARIPLSLTQQRLWLLDQVRGGSATYNNIYAIRLEGSLDAAAMAAALTRISGRHDVLRTCFPSVDGEPWQRISPPGPISLRQEDLSALPEPERLAAARNVLSEQQSAAFDLETGPLARYVLLRLAAGEHVLVIVMHHIICDSTSFAVLYAELGQFYPALAAGQTLDAEPLALQYADYAVWQRAMAGSGRWDGQLRFWREHLKDAPPAIRLPADRTRPAGRPGQGPAGLPGQGASYEFSADEALTAALLRLGTSAGVTPFMLLFAAFGLLSGRYQGGGGGDVVIGVPIDGRFDRRLGALIGMFINTLAVRVRYSPDVTFRGLIGDVRDTLLEAYGNADVPFDWVVREVAPRRDAASNPLFNVMVQLQHTDAALDDVGELTASWVRPAHQPARFDISLDAWLDDGRLTCEITYATELLSESAVARIADEYVELLTAVAASPDRPVSALDLRGESAAAGAIEKPAGIASTLAWSAVAPYREPATALEAVTCGIIADVLGVTKVGADDNFFDLGGHSLLAIKLMRRVNEATGVKTPIRTVFERPTAAGLAGLISGHDQDTPADDDLRAEAALDPSIVPADLAQPPRPAPEAILLTGATGLFGVHVLAQLLEQTQAGIWCLVRAAEPDAGLARIQDAMTRHRLWRQQWRTRLVPVCGDLSRPLLGLGRDEFSRLAERIDVIYHVGASVNLLESYAQARPANVLGTQELLRLAVSHHAKAMHYVSTMNTIAGGPGDPAVLPEDWQTDPQLLARTGYTRSKWVAEQMVRIARSRKLPTAIYRLGRLCGDSSTGAMAHSDAFWHYVRACVELHAMPSDAESEINLIPVDFAAAVVVRLAQSARSWGQEYAVTSPRATSLRVVLDHLRRRGYALEAMPYLRWLELLEATAEQRPAGETSSVHSVALLDSVATAPAEAAAPASISRDNLERDLAGSGLTCPVIDEALLDRYLAFFTESGFLPPASDGAPAVAEDTAAPPPEFGYWREAFAGHDMGNPLGIDSWYYRAGPRPEGKACQFSVQLTAEQSAALTRRATELGVSVAAAVHACVAVQLHRYLAADEVIYGAVLPGTAGSEQVVVPVRLTVHDDAPLDELTRRTDQSLRTPAGIGSSRLTDVATWLGRPADELFPLVIGAEPGNTAVCPISLTIRPDDLTVLTATFDAGRFTPQDVRGLLTGLVTVIAEAPRTDTIGELLHRSWQASTRSARGRGAGQHAGDVPPDFLARFDAAVRRSPSAIAVRNGTQTRTFAELDRHSRAIGAALQARGHGAGATIAIRMEPGIGMPAAIIGVLRAGAAFVPVDSRAADLRTQRMLRSIRTSLVVHAEQAPPDGFPPAAAWQELLAEGAEPGTSADPPPADPAATAYVIFTSGSTGEPKAVPVSRRALAGYLDWAVTRYLRSSPHGAPLFSSIAFDLPLTSMLAPLASGRTLWITDPGQGIAAVAALLATGARFGFVKLTPSHLRLLVATLDEAPPAGAVGCLVVGGEQLPADLVHAWRRICPDTVVVNEYGPTEATIGCCVYEIRPADPVPSPVPIGQPIPGALLRVLDARADPVPDGVPGELYIGGPCLADGYLAQPELTARHFISDPFADQRGRLYRTGDLVRWQPDGMLGYLGRNDEQLKIRGFRIEPTEVESAIRECQQVTDCAVTCWRRDDDDLRLVAHIVGRDSVPWASLLAAVTGHLAGRLPGYLIPVHYLPVASIPHTSSGKVDRRRLAPPAGRA